MKNLIFVFLILGLFKSYAQVPLEVKIEPRPSSQGMQAAFEVIVPQATPDDAMKLWEKTITSGGLFSKSPKMENIKDEWIIKDIVIDEISPDTLNVYSQVSSFPGNIYVRIFLHNEDGFLGSPGTSEQAAGAAGSFIRNYAVELYRQAVEKELKEEENKLNSLEGDYNKMDRQNRSYNKKINKAEKEEDSLRDDLKDEKKLLKDTRKSEDSGKSTEEKEAAQEELEKNIKDVSKDIKKAEKSQSRFEKKIDKNETQQEDLEEKIEMQRERVNEVKRKLESIR
jgi:flagellar biosynthesis GTPase FlhF